MNKFLTIAVALCVAVALSAALYFGKNSISNFGGSVDSSVLSIKRSSKSFSKNRFSFLPGEKVSLKLFNGLSDQDVVFYILKEGEDPTLVQHLKVQQGDLPEEYFYFKGDKVAPKSEITLDFTAPNEEGDYYFVGIGDLPMDSLYGKLSIQKPQEVVSEVQ